MFQVTLEKLLYIELRTRSGFILVLDQKRECYYLVEFNKAVYIEQNIAILTLEDVLFENFNLVLCSSFKHVAL